MAVNDEIHEQSSKVVKERLAVALKGKQPIVYDTVGTNPEKIAKLLKDATDAGFHVHMALAYADVDTSLKSNRERERTVPEDIVKDGHKKVTDNWPSYKNIPGVGSVDKLVR